MIYIGKVNQLSSIFLYKKSKIIGTRGSIKEENSMIERFIK